MLCDHIGWSDSGDLLRAAVRAGVRARQTTQDLGGTRSTHEVGEWLLEYVTQAKPGV
jgi:isocitrate/isopropylmalate dehydrogenase